MRPWVSVGAAMAFIGVGLGAFAAHGLKQRLTPELLAVFETGVRYHLVHAIALVVLGGLLGAGDQRLITSAAWAMLAGIIVFSGSLYVLAWTGTRAWGAVTPIGGLCFLAGWALLAIGAARSS